MWDRSILQSEVAAKREPRSRSRRSTQGIRNDLHRVRNGYNNSNLVENATCGAKEEGGGGCSDRPREESQRSPWGFHGAAAQSESR